MTPITRILSFLGYTPRWVKSYQAGFEAGRARERYLQRPRPPDEAAKLRELFASRARPEVPE